MLINTYPRFSPVLLYFTCRCKLGVTFARRCFSHGNTWRRISILSLSRSELWQSLRRTSVFATSYWVKCAFRLLFYFWILTFQLVCFCRDWLQYIPQYATNSSFHLQITANSNDLQVSLCVYSNLVPDHCLFIIFYFSIYTMWALIAAGIVEHCVFLLWHSLEIFSCFQYY